MVWIFLWSLFYDHKLGHPPTSRIAPPWGKGDPPISVTGMLPRLLGKTRAGGNMWQHMCSLDSPEFKDALLIARAKKGSEHTPDEHMILSRALKHEKAQAHASKPAPFIIPPGIAVIFLHFTKFLTIHRRTLTRYIYQWCSNMTIVRVIVKSIVA